MFISLLWITPKRKNHEKNAWYLINEIEKPSKSNEFGWNLSVNAHICPVKHVILIGPQPLNSSERLHLKATSTHTHLHWMKTKWTQPKITRSNITMFGQWIKWDKPSGICRAYYVAGKLKVLLSLWNKTFAFVRFRFVFLWWRTDIELSSIFSISMWNFTIFFYRMCKMRFAQ